MAEKNIMRPRGAQGMRREPKEYDERVVEVARVSRVVKGGRRIRFRALVVIGNRKGKVGMGVAKASEVAEAVRKAAAQAKKHLIEVPIINGTIPHEVQVKYGSAKVMLKPATPGTTIVAGGSVRIVAELAGITDILSKIMGSSSKINNVSATLLAFSSFHPEIVAKVKKYAEYNDAREQNLVKQKDNEQPKVEEQENKPAVKPESEKPAKRTPKNAVEKQAAKEKGE